MRQRLRRLEDVAEGGLGGSDIRRFAEPLVHGDAQAGVYQSSAQLARRFWRLVYPFSGAGCTRYARSPHTSGVAAAHLPLAIALAHDAYTLSATASCTGEGEHMSVRQRIGVMVPSTNTTCEADFQLLATPGVTIHGQRLWLTDEFSGEAGMNRMNEEIESGARYLATAKVNVISYGCTTGSFFKGPGWDREMLSLIQRAANAPAVATSPSVVEALRYFGARRLSVATPYPDWNNQRLRAYLEAQGFEIVNLEAEPVAADSGNQGINDQDPDVIAEFVSRMCRPEADAILCSCTAWRSLEAAEEIEQRTSKPVVTSNQAAFWSCLRTLGITTPIIGYGRLLSDPIALAA